MRVFAQCPLPHWCGSLPNVHRLIKPYLSLHSSDRSTPVSHRTHRWGSLSDATARHLPFDKSQSFRETLKTFHIEQHFFFLSLLLCLLFCSLFRSGHLLLRHTCTPTHRQRTIEKKKNIQNNAHTHAHLHTENTDNQTKYVDSNEWNCSCVSLLALKMMNKRKWWWWRQKKKRYRENTTHVWGLNLEYFYF